MPDFPTSPLRGFPRRMLAAFLLVSLPAGLRAGETRLPEAAARPVEAKPSEQPGGGASAASEAGEALRKSIAYHREAKDLALKFQASVYNAALDKQDRYQGKLLLKGAARFRLEIPGGVYVCDGESYWEYHAQNHQVILKTAKDMEDKPLPGEVLLRFLDSEPLSIGQAVDGGKEFLRLSLDPSRAMKNLDSLTVLLDKRDYSVHRISSRDVAGNEAEYTVASIKRNGGLKDKEFAFSVPKGVDVVDMRE